MNDQLARTMLVENIARVSYDGEPEELVFEPGLNLITGESNSGKTTWLQTLDYLLGDMAGPVAGLKSFFVEKYSAISATLNLGGASYFFERRWESGGKKNKLYIDGIQFEPEDVQSFLMQQLQITEIRVPLGNPFEPRTWPKLSWRQLFRHVYRKQYSWADLAAKQPDSQQRYVLLHFLGLAEEYFPPHVPLLASKQAELAKLEEALSREYGALQALVGEDWALEDYAERLVGRMLSVRSLIGELEETRNLRLRELGSAEEWANHEAEGGSQLAELELLAHEQKRLTGELQSSEEMADELKGDLDLFVNERARLKRVRVSGKLISQLKITHCPACDKSVSSEGSIAGECFLCHQALEREESWSPSADDRVRLELKILDEQEKETRDLLGKLSQKVADLRSSLASVRRRRDELEIVVRRQVGPEQRMQLAQDSRLQQIDIELGKLIEQANRLREAEEILARTTAQVSRVQDLRLDIQRLEQDFKKAADSSFTKTAEEQLAEGFNEYFELIPDEKKHHWIGGEVSARLGRDSADFFVNGKRWQDALGATQTMLFFMAYQYALLRLSNAAWSNYPGFAMIDLPAEFIESELGGHENFVLEPFIQLIKRSSKRLQVIATGHSFSGLQCPRNVMSERYR